MTLSDISIRKPVFAWMIMAFFLLFGGLSFFRLGVSQLPDVEIPNVNISVTLEGAAPELIETELIDPIEDAVMSVSGITDVSSTSRTGRGNISIEFDLSKDIDIAVSELQTAVSGLMRNFPEDTEPPIISKVDPNDSPIAWFTVTSDTLTEMELMAFVRNRLRDAFTTIPGVAEVFLGGYVDPSLRLWLSSDKLNQYALTVADVLNSIREEHKEAPAGRIESLEKEYNVRTLGEATTPEELGNFIIQRRGGALNFVPIAVRDVATVESGMGDVRRKSRSMGKPAVGLGIKKQRGSNAVEVMRRAKIRADEVAKTLPEGVHIALNFDSTQFIRESIADLNFTLLLSAVLTAIVCWLFLGTWSATLNILLSIPFSIVGTFIALYFLGFTLNAFTLLGLSLAIGIVVDDAILVLENIVRHFEKSKNRVGASLIGAREITFAAIAATAAIIAIFLPIAFMKGIIGQYLYQFGVTLSIAVSLSLLEALTLTPMRCSQLLTPSQRKTRLEAWINSVFEFLAQRYGQTLRWTLDNRGKTVAISFGFFALSLLCLKPLKQEFIPSQDQSRLMLRVQTPVGSSLDYTDKKFQEIERRVAALPETDRYYGAIGGFGGGDVNSGVIFVTLKPAHEREMSQQDLAGQLRQEFRGMGDTKVTIQDLSVSGFSGRRGFPIEFTIRGPDWEKLISFTKDFMKEMEATSEFQDVDTNYRIGMPEIQVRPDRDRSRERRVSVTDINQTIQALIGGVRVGQFSSGGRRYDIRARLLAAERDSAEDIKKLKIRNAHGELIPLSEVVTIEEKESLQAIYRQNRERAITVYANVAKGSSQGQGLETVKRLGQKLLPNPYRVEFSGSAQTFKESFSGLNFAILLGVAVAYMILASQFNSFIHPFTVLIALPFSISGALISLLITGQTLNLFSMIGIVLLMGIVKKNSILLVDFTNQARETEPNVKKALLTACPARLRPILMTSISTIAAAIPAAMALGPGSELRIPMAISVIGGVFISTLLTLFVVPALYSLLARRSKAAES